MSKPAAGALLSGGYQKTGACTMRSASEIASDEVSRLLIGSACEIASDEVSCVNVDGISI